MSLNDETRFAYTGVRTPYNKERAVAGSTTFDILRAVQAGYAIVIRDVLGRSASEGKFDPMIHEAAHLCRLIL